MATRLNGVEDISREARRLTDAEMKRYRPVSYTHLDVYKRQVLALLFAETWERNDYPNFLPVLNLFLQETYELNNGLRRRRGAEALSACLLYTSRCV